MVYPAMVALVLLMFVASINAKMYSISPGTRIINNSSLEGMSDKGGPGYRIVQAGGDKIVSENGTFCLAFYDPLGSGEYTLTVLMTVETHRVSTAVPIWTANTNSSVSDGAVLMLTESHKKFILLDGGVTGSLKWTSGNVTGIASLELTESGNLIFYNGDGVGIWESFKYPTNILVPGQDLVTGMSLRSSNWSSIGRFQGVMEASGFVLYVLPVSEATMANMIRKPQPYRLWSLQGGHNMESVVKRCGSSDAVMTFDKDGVSISYTNGASCGGPVEVIHTPESSNKRYLKLESKGDLTLYEFVGNWKPVFGISGGASDSCKLPTACGSYGLCNGDGKCQCVSDVDLEAPSPQHCSPPSGVSTTCLANEGENHHFVMVQGATYFSSYYTRPDLENVGDDVCKRHCIVNCSCAAAFYEGDTKRCFMVEEVMGSLSMDRAKPRSMGYVKIQNAHIVTEETGKTRVTKSAKTAIVFLAVLCFVLAGALAAIVLLVKTKYPHAYNKIMRKN